MGASRAVRESEWDPQDHPHLDHQLPTVTWGSTRLLFCTFFTHLVRIDGLEGGFTSRMQQQLRPHDKLRIFIAGNPPLLMFIAVCR